MQILNINSPDYCTMESHLGSTHPAAIDEQDDFYTGIIQSCSYGMIQHDYYLKGLLHGFRLSWNSQDYLVEQTIFVSNYKHGLSYLYHNKGQLKKISYYELGLELWCQNFDQQGFFIDKERFLAHSEQLKLKQNTYRLNNQIIIFYNDKNCNLIKTPAMFLKTHEDTQPSSVFKLMSIPEFQYQIIANFLTKISNQVEVIKTLSTRRPLLAREKIELEFLQKIQAADTLEALQSIENELISTPTDLVLIQQLLHNVSEKKAFY